MHHPSPDQFLDGILLETRDPDTVRRRFMAGAMKAFDAPFASQYTVRFDPEDGALRLARPAFVGSESFEALAKASEGVVMADYDGSAEWWGDIGATALQDHQLPDAMTEHFWRPFGIRSVITLNTAEDGRFAGNYNVFRTTEQPRFTPADADRPDWVKATHRMQALVDDLYAAREPTAPIVRLFHLDGSPFLSSHEASATSSRLLDHVIAFAKRDGPSEEHRHEGRNSRLTRLSDGTTSAVLVVERPMVDVRFGRFMTLGRAQRQAAAFAANGATVLEIAAAMRRSPSTVKSWLKQTYQQLGISTRTELVEAYTEAMTRASGVAT